MAARLYPTRRGPVVGAAGACYPSRAVPLLTVLSVTLALAGPSASVSPHRAFVPPRPPKYATDRTGRLPAARVAALNEKLAAFERQTSTQVLVYVDARLPAGTTLEEFTNAAFHEWGIGQKGKDNGVLFVAFLDDRVMRLEVGYGLEGALPDARARQITSDFVKPRFRAGDYQGGIDAAADQILSAARGEPYRGTGRTVAQGTRPPPEPPLALKVFFALFLSALGAAVVWGFVHSWRGAGSATPAARWARRAGALCWTLLALIALAVPVAGLPPLALALGLFELGLVCGAIRIALEKTGFAFVREAVGRLGLMVAAALAPGVWHGLMTGVLDLRELYVMGGSLLVGLLGSVTGLGTGPSSGGSRSWSSSGSDSSWSSSSSSSDSSWSSSSSSDSSSSFSGGGGDSGGGGSSDSW